MESRNVFVLFVSIFALGLGQGNFQDGHNSFMAKISEDRLNLCDATSGESTLIVHFFNLTNPKEFQNAGKPAEQIGHFEEIGPYIFREVKTRSKCAISIDELNISFDEDRELQFVPELSSDLFQDVVTTANVPFQVLGHEILKYEMFPTMSISSFTSKGEFYIKSNVTSAFLTEGVDIQQYKTHIVERVPRGVNDFDILTQDDLTILKDWKIPRSKVLSSELAAFGQILKLDDRDIENNCPTTVSATEGYSFFSGVKPSCILYTYSEELCRPLPLEFKETVTYSGISALKFVPKNIFNSNYDDCTNSKNKKDENLSASPSTGLYDVKSCQGGLPYMISFPHFLESDESLTRNITGLAPDANLHQSYFIVEPITGKVLESSRKFQVNVNLTKFPEEGFSLEEYSVPNTIFPVFWTERNFKLESTAVNILRQYLEELAQTTTTTTVATTTKTSSEVETSTSGKDSTHSQSTSTPATTLTATMTQTQATKTTTESTWDPNPISNSYDFSNIISRLNKLSSNLRIMTEIIIVCIVIIFAFMTAFMYILLRRQNYPAISPYHHQQQHQHFDYPDEKSPA